MPNPVTLNDAIDLAIGYSLNNLHTAMPASIIEYDFTKQKATVQPLLNKAWADGTSTPFLPLENVPVIFPKSGGASLTFPVNQGDTCLLLFIERSTDLWLTVGGQVTPDDNRKFDLSDAVAIMGLFPFSESSQSQNNSDVLLTYKGSYITIKENGDVVIKTSSKVAIGNQTTELLDILSQTLNLLATSVTSVVGSPFTFAPQWLALQTQLDLIKGTIP